MSTIQVKAVAPGLLVEVGVRISDKAVKSYFAPFVGKTIKNVILQNSEDSSNPQIVLEFEQGGAGIILSDPEGNGPGFLEFNAD